MPKGGNLQGDDVSKTIKDTATKLRKRKVTKLSAGKTKITEKKIKTESTGIERKSHEIETSNTTPAAGVECSNEESTSVKTEIITKTKGRNKVQLSAIKRVTRGRTKPTKLDSSSLTKENKTPSASDSKTTKKSTKSTIKTKRNVKLENPVKTWTKKNCAEKNQSNVKMKKFVGAHLSIAGGLEKVIYEAKEVGARAVGLFLKSQRTWKSKPLDDKTVEKFKRACEVRQSEMQRGKTKDNFFRAAQVQSSQEESYPVSKILPHGSYLMNCGSPNPELLTKSRNSLIDDLKRCERLGIQLFNFHPGSTCGEISVAECIARISESINIAHAETNHVTVVIENMSCQGNTVGGKMEELRAIIDQVKDKGRIGVCLDTCHAFAAGFDIRTKAGYEQMMGEFDDIIGLDYLKAIHLNDSKGEVGCHKDRHENIGKGKIGLECFRVMMSDLRLDNIPMILETPLDIDDRDEIKLLYSL